MTDDPERTAITWAQFVHLFIPFYTFQYAVGISAATALANGLVGSWASTVYVSFYFEIRRSREPGFDPATFSAPDVS